MRDAVQKIVKQFSGFGAGKTVMVALVIVGFVAGYNSMFSYVRSCSAQPLPVVAAPPVSGGNCICCAPWSCPQPCDPSGTASNIQVQLTNALKVSLTNMSIAVESNGPTPAGSGISYAVNTLVEGILERLNQIELDIISWWQAMWLYNLKPAMQQETRQINTANPDQVKTIQSAIDSTEQSLTSLQQQENETKAAKTFKPSEEVCVVGTNAGGLGRASEFSKGVRKSMERLSREKGLGKQGTPAARGPAASERLRHDAYEAIFCDPNGGKNPCAGNANFYNADTQVTRQLYNNLTINFDNAVDGPRVEATIEALMENMVGSTAAETIQAESLRSAAGYETFINRRSFLARHAAIKTVPQQILGWRTPGSHMGVWVKQLRTDAGVPAAAMSDSPSYREIMHAMTIDRFNSGKFALKNIASQSEIEKEKLMLSAFYLMMLRDYFELLERRALVMTVHVAIMADEFKMPDATSAKKGR